LTIHLKVYRYIGLFANIIMKPVTKQKKCNLQL